MVAVLAAGPWGWPTLAHANPESLGAWNGSYAIALGIEGPDLPGEGEYADDFDAIATHPKLLVAFGLVTVSAGDPVRLHSHENGYWTVTDQRSGQHIKIALAWRVRFGLQPEPELEDGEPPDHIAGRVLEPTQLVALGFTTGATATRFSLDYVDETWVLTLLPSGEKQRVPV